jgi:hypothetical protein
MRLMCRCYSSFAEELSNEKQPKRGSYI